MTRKAYYDDPAYSFTNLVRGAVLDIDKTYITRSEQKEQPKDTIRATSTSLGPSVYAGDGAPMGELEQHASQALETTARQLDIVGWCKAAHDSVKNVAETIMDPERRNQAYRDFLSDSPGDNADLRSMGEALLYVAPALGVAKSAKRGMRPTGKNAKRSNAAAPAAPMSSVNVKKSAELSAYYMRRAESAAAQAARDYTVWAHIPGAARGVARFAKTVLWDGSQSLTGAIYRKSWSHTGHKVLGRFFGTGNPGPLTWRQAWRPWEKPVSGVDFVKNVGAVVFGGPGVPWFVSAPVTYGLYYGARRYWNAHNAKVAAAAGAGQSPGDGDKAIKEGSLSASGAVPEPTTADQVIDTALGNFELDQNPERLARALQAVSPTAVSNRRNRVSAEYFRAKNGLDMSTVYDIDQSDFRYNKAQEMLHRHEEFMNTLPEYRQLKFYQED